MPASTRRPDYGVDGYGYVVGLLAAGVGLPLVGGVILTLGSRALAVALFVLGTVALVPGVLGIVYVKRGKFRHRDRVLDRATWRGDEQTLDIGTGGGLLLIGAAKRAPRGRAFGVDIWSPEDLSGNTLARALDNADLEGVAERVEIRGEDARRLSFADATFDAVFSMLCLHNIDDEAGRESALREAVRVCKPGGSILISDLAETAHYECFLRGLGLEVTRSGPFADTFPPQRLVEARKPRADS